eukprot:s1854_g16.t1
MIARKFTKSTPVPPELLKLEDEDVKAEKERVQQVDPRKQVMYVNGLRKAYGSIFSSEVTHAVRGVTWAADQGMVFGLLGVNGAGKTTSFKLMSGILTPSAGEVRILGIDMVEETSSARRLIGYCPQFDALIHVMTVESHLYLYGRMKGITGKDLKTAVDEKISEMQLEMYRTRRAGTLSGGANWVLGGGPAGSGGGADAFAVSPNQLDADWLIAAWSPVASSAGAAGCPELDAGAPGGS